MSIQPGLGCLPVILCNKKPAAKAGIYLLNCRQSEPGTGDPFYFHRAADINEREL